MGTTTQNVGYSTTLVAIECGDCHIPFGLPTNLQAAAVRDGRTFYCPNGHRISYTESENDRLRKRNERLQENVDWAYASRKAALDQAQTAERRRAAAKGQLTKVKRRVAAGVCPCCNRTFQDLARHMAGQHPSYAAPTESA